MIETSTCGARDGNSKCFRAAHDDEIHRSPMGRTWRVASPEARPDGPERPPRRPGDDTHMSARASSLGRPAGMKLCDDCTQMYPGPAYYTFHPRDCKTSNRNGPATPHADCTGNLCPRCAGPYLEPDREDDPRRPTW